MKTRDTKVFWLLKTNWTTGTKWQEMVLLYEFCYILEFRSEKSRQGNKKIQTFTLGDLLRISVQKQIETYV